MAKPSSTRKVAKVARTGGGRTTGRGQTSWFFPTLLTCVAVLGVFLIGFSRSQRQPDLTPPRVGSDHWHSAIGFDICGTFAPSIPDNGEDPLGIHTHGDGVVHTHPFSSQAAGARARLGHYFDTLDITVTEDRIEIPGAEPKENGDRCGDREGSIQVKVWETRAPDDDGEIFEGDPGDIRLGNNQLITIAFVPDGTEIRKPPSEPQLDNLTDLGPTAATTIPVPTTAPGETTLPPGDATTTLPPGATIPETPGTSTSVP